MWSNGIRNALNQDLNATRGGHCYVYCTTRYANDFMQMNKIPCPPFCTLSEHRGSLRFSAVLESHIC
jgi:hypothetical protein